MDYVRLSIGLLYLSGYGRCTLSDRMTQAEARKEVPNGYQYGASGTRGGVSTVAVGLLYQGSW